MGRKFFVYVVDIIIALLVFASCKEENSIMPSDSEPYYEILVSASDVSATRATYREQGENIVVEWEKGDEIFFGDDDKEYLFVFKGMEGDKAKFSHYGEIPNADKWTGYIRFGEHIERDQRAHQLQMKNNECKEHLFSEVVTPIDLTQTLTIPLMPEEESLLHVHVKSPGLFLGGSMMRVLVGPIEYSVQLGNDPSKVFADYGDELDIFAISKTGLSVSKGDKLKFIFYSYDKMSGTWEQGTEYHYYMKVNKDIAVVYNEVVKLQLPDDPTHTAIQLGLSVKWASENVGAKAETDYGSYFWWGDVVGYEKSNPTKFNFAKENPVIDTYNRTPEQLFAAGIIDDKGNLVPDRDAATQHWGPGWRMPTKEECEELLDKSKCIWERETDPIGYKFRSVHQEYPDDMYFPLSSYINGTGTLNDDYKGFFRGATIYSLTYNDQTNVENTDLRLYKSYGLMLAIKNNALIVCEHNDANRFSGVPVRPVKIPGVD